MIGETQPGKLLGVSILTRYECERADTRPTPRGTPFTVKQ